MTLKLRSFISLIFPLFIVSKLLIWSSLKNRGKSSLLRFLTGTDSYLFNGYTTINLNSNLIMDKLIIELEEVSS